MYQKNNHLSAPTRTGGFTLVEVLVAVLVLSIGLLGVASLQATSMRLNADASMQTIASYLVSDMADRMRANSSEAATYVGNYVATTGGIGSCEAVTCSTAQMVVSDTVEWNTQLAELPAGQGTITTAAGLFTITVLWDEARTGVNGTNCNIDDPADLRCLSITIQP